MKVLVTGGCGFLGAALARALVERGHQVRVLDRPGASRQGLAGIDPEVLAGDVRDPAQVRRAVRGCAWVFHTAAVVGFWRRNNAQQRDVNVNGTRTVMEACLAEGVERVVHTSSVNALGFPADPAVWADEDTPFNWARFEIGYMDSKRAGDQQVLSLARTGGLPAVIVHPGTIFGPGPASNINANGYLIQIRRGRLPFYPVGGTNCVGLSDVVAGQLLAAERGRNGRRYILGGENLLYRTLFHRIAVLVGGRAPRLPVPELLATGLGRVLEAVSHITGREPLLTPEMVRAAAVCNFYSSARAERELGYRPRPFAEALLETASFLRAQGLIR
jgi:dihydroflavonol-4-reductase